MNQLRFLIVEENPSSASNLVRQIKKIGYQPAKIVHNIEMALLFLSTETIDAVISNVYFNRNADGLKLAATLNKVNIPIFFITDSDDVVTYQTAKQYRPAGYLVHPIQTVNLLSVIESGFQEMKHPLPIKEHNKEGFIIDAFFVKQNNLFRKIPIDEVLWIKTEGNYSLIHTTTKKYIIKLSLKKVLDQLPSTYFIQIQRAYIIALPKIDDIDI